MFNEYLKQIADKYKTGDSLEHTFRTDFENVWNYYIGGYQVLDKWLKERKKHNYILTGDDVRHFIKVCDVLAETIKLQEKIDELTREWV